MVLVSAVKVMRCIQCFLVLVFVYERPIIVCSRSRQKITLLDTDGWSVSYKDSDEFHTSLQWWADANATTAAAAAYIPL